MAVLDNTRQNITSTETALVQTKEGIQKVLGFHTEFSVDPAKAHKREALSETGKAVDSALAETKTLKTKYQRQLRGGSAVTHGNE